EAGPALKQSHRRGLGGAGELRIRLVDDDYPCAVVVGGFDDVETDRGAGRIVRGAQEDDVRIRTGHLGGDRVGVEGEVVLAFDVLPFGTCPRGDERVHRI